MSTTRRLGNAAVAWAVAVAMTVGLAAPAAFAAGVASPGKNSAYASANGVSIPNTFAVVPAVDVQIVKGKKKRVLEIDVTVIDTSLTTEVLGALVTVNGVAVEPGPGDIAVTAACAPGTYINCTLDASFWLDLDAAELANPGLFIKQPLNISTTVASGVTPTTGAVSVRARMVKK